MLQDRKVIQNALWSLLEKGGQQGLSLIIFLILARLMGPTEYGLANLCFIFFTLTSLITSGLVDGIVSNQIDDDLQLSSLFWGILAIGITISATCALAAEPLSGFMSEPKLHSLLIWFSIVPILVALPAVPNLLLLKQMAFKTYAVRAIIATLIGGVVGIYMAQQGCGASAIIGQQIASYLITNFIIWRAASWRPSLRFSKAALISAIEPGMSVMAVNALTFLDGQAPRFFIAKILGAEALGCFALAVRIRYSITEILVSSPLAVIYPILAKLKTDISRQAAIAEAAIYMSGLIVFPLLAIAIATADQYVLLFFGAKWMTAVPILQIYLVFAALAPILVIIQQLFRANNKMYFIFRAGTLFIFANLFMILFLFVDNGLLLMSLGILGIAFASLVYYCNILKTHLDIKLFGAIAQLTWPTVGSVLIFSAIFSFQHLVNLEDHPGLNLALSCVIGSIVYILFCISFQFNRINGSINRIMQLRNQP